MCVLVHVREELVRQKQKRILETISVWHWCMKWRWQWATLGKHRIHTPDDFFSMLQASKLIQVWELAALFGVVNVALSCLHNLVNLHTTHDSLCKVGHQQKV